MYKKILIATDGSELAGKALHHGLALAKSVGAKVVIVTVTEMWSALEMAKSARAKAVSAVEEFEKFESEHAAEVLVAAGEIAKKANVDFKTCHISDSRPSEGILQAARDQSCDLIVIATHGRRGINRLLLGSQANEVITHSEIPVLMLR